MRSSGVLKLIHKTVLNRDNYGETANFHIDGESEHKSISGALLSISVLVLAAMFGLNKFMIMQDYGDTSFNKNIEVGAIDGSEKFDQTQTNLKTAFGVYNQRTQSMLTIE